MCDGHKCTDPRRCAWLDRRGLAADDPERRRHQHSTTCTAGTGCDLTTARPASSLKLSDVARLLTDARRIVSRVPFVIADGKLRPRRAGDRVFKIIGVNQKPLSQWTFERLERLRIAALGRSMDLAPGVPLPARVNADLSELRESAPAPQHDQSVKFDSRPLPAGPLRGPLVEPRDAAAEQPGAAKDAPLRVETSRPDDSPLRVRVRPDLSER